MKIVISVDKDCKLNAQDIMATVKQKVKKITQIYTLGFSQTEKDIETWAEENKIEHDLILPDWDDIEVEGASIKTKTDYKSGKEIKYNARAGFMRDEAIMDEADILVWHGAPTDFRASIIEKAKNKNKKVIYLDE